MLLLLFGVIGCGKNYVGRILEEEFGFYFYDADRILTPGMKDAIKNHQEITDQVRDEYVEVVIAKIAELVEKHKNLAIGQALFKERHRRQILRLLPGTKFVWVQADSEIIGARLLGRRGNIATKHYAEMRNSQFEPPTIPHSVIVNNAGKDKIIMQIIDMLKEA